MPVLSLLMENDTAITATATISLNSDCVRLEATRTRTFLGGGGVGGLLLLQSLLSIISPAFSNHNISLANYMKNVTYGCYP